MPNCTVGACYYFRVCRVWNEESQSVALQQTSVFDFKYFREAKSARSCRETGEGLPAQEQKKAAHAQVQRVILTDSSPDGGCRGQLLTGFGRWLLETAAFSQLFPNLEESTLVNQG